MALPSIYDVTRSYMYGSNETPSDFLSNSLLTKGPITEIVVNVADIMNSETGPGRFANATQSALVASFFDNVSVGWSLGWFDNIKNAAGEVVLTKVQAANLFELDSYGIDVNQAWFGAQDGDYMERVYVWGTMSFKLSDDVIFKISSDGTPTIENFSIVMRDQLNNGREDFDWTGGSLIGDLGSAYGLRPGIDPSDLAGSTQGNALGLVYGGDYLSENVVYGLTNYQADLDRFSQQYDGTTSELFSAMQRVVDDLFDQGVSATLYQGKAIIFGSNAENDNISGAVTPSGYNLETDGLLDFPIRDFALHGIASARSRSAVLCSSMRRTWV